MCNKLRRIRDIGTKVVFNRIFRCWMLVREHAVLRKDPSIADTTHCSAQLRTRHGLGSKYDARFTNIARRRTPRISSPLPFKIPCAAQCQPSSFGILTAGLSKAGEKLAPRTASLAVGGLTAEAAEALLLAEAQEAIQEQQAAQAAAGSLGPPDTAATKASTLPHASCTLVQA